jgi:pyruvate dehydrogenase complex dehydrogenase (E1) component
VDAENIALAALTALAQQGKFPQKELPKAIQKLGLDPDHPNPVLV